MLIDNLKRILNCLPDIVDEDMDTEEDSRDAGSSPKASPTKVAAKRALNRFQIKCARCEFRVSTPALLESHSRVKHLDLEWFRCKLCNFCSATSEWMEGHLSSDRHKQQQKKEDKTSGLSAFEMYVECINRSSAEEDVLMDVMSPIEDTVEESPAPPMEEDQATKEAADAAKADSAEEEELELEPPKKKRGRPKLESTTTCGYCGLVVSNATNLSVHVRRKHSKEYGYSCTLCNYSCVTKGDMDRHCITKKHERRAQECAGKNPTSNHETTSLEEPTAAQEQDPSTASQATYKEEKEEENTTPPEHSGEEQGQSDTSQRKSNVNACSHCDFVAQSLPSLHLHVKRKHTKDFEYVCLACNYYAVTSREMYRHANTEKHKQKGQKYLDQNVNEGQKASALPLKLREAVEIEETNPSNGCEPATDAEKSVSGSDDCQAVEKQKTSEPAGTTEAASAVASGAGSADGKQAESLEASSGGVAADPAMSKPQQAPAEPQPARQTGQEKGAEQAAVEEPEADLIILGAKGDGSPSDTQMSKALPFDDCIISMKAFAEQEHVLEEGVALEGEAAAICLTGSSPVSGSPALSNSTYVKKLKRQKVKVRYEAKGCSSRIRCDDCGFMADGVSGLNVHISMKHPSKEKHFHCLVCGKSFYTESNLHQHLTSAAHLRNEQNSMEELPGGGASFKCVKCTDRFETERDLFVHIKEKHEELLREVNKYVLEDTEQINREREENQGCVCKYCGKVCKGSNSMAFLAHVRTHTGMYPFSVLV